MRRSLDRARPTRLTEDELQQAFKSNEMVGQLHEARVQATACCQKMFGSVERSKESAEYATHLKACRDLQGLTKS